MNVLWMVSSMVFYEVYSKIRLSHVFGHDRSRASKMLLNQSPFTPPIEPSTFEPCPENYR